MANKDSGDLHSVPPGKALSTKATPSSTATTQSLERLSAQTESPPIAPPSESSSDSASSDVTEDPAELGMAPAATPSGIAANSASSGIAPDSAATLDTADILSETGVADEDLVGKTIDGRFRIESRLGRGGMSEVYRAEHLVLQKPLAIKILHQTELGKAKSIERFQQEARAISSLDHPNIVKVHAFGKSGGRFYLAMDYLEGVSLAELLENEKSLDWKRVIDLCLQIASGLDHAHSRGVIHRDLKPSNIVVQSVGLKDSAKLVDFGIARLTADSGKDIKQLTLAGNTCGSPPYMSPEQCMGQEVDARSDIYSFACMMYELLSGKRPFQAKSNIELMQKHIQSAPRFFKLSCPQSQIPESLEAIVRKGLEKKASNRYQSMADLIEDLKEVGTSSDSEAKLKHTFKLQVQLTQQESSDLKKNLKVLILPIAISIFFLFGAGLLLSKVGPQLKIMQLKQDLNSIAISDSKRFDKSFQLISELLELEKQEGNLEGSFLRLRSLERELRLLPESGRQGHLMVKLGQSYKKMGKENEGQKILDEMLPVLESNAQKYFNTKSYAELEQTSIEILKICRDDLSKQDHMFGQYNMLIPIFLWRNDFAQAEKLARRALQLIRSRPQANSMNEIVMLINLSSALMSQSKLLQAEETLTRAWELCLKDWTATSPIAKNVGAKLLECYTALGKTKEATELTKLLQE